MVTFWDGATGRHLRTFERLGVVGSLQLSPNGTCFAFLDGDGLIHIGDVRKPGAPAPLGKAERFAFSPDSSFIVAAGEPMMLWDVSSFTGVPAWKSTEPIPAKLAQFRTWTAIGGATLTAKLAGRGIGAVDLERENGSILTVALNQLSEADRGFLEPEKTPPAEPPKKKGKKKKKKKKK